MKKTSIYAIAVIVIVCTVISAALEVQLKHDKRQINPRFHLASYPLPLNSSSHKFKFVNKILPLVIKSNEKVAWERSRIIEIARKKAKASGQDKRFILRLSRKYRVDTIDYDKRIQKLLSRVDILPPSLVIAQAALESGWGRSRFSLEANNIFGIRTLSNRGIVPSERMDGVRISVFKDLQSCIDYHILNINSHPMYVELRKIRQEMDPPFDPLILARGLKNYSEQGNTYVHKIVRIIRVNNLRKYDRLVTGMYYKYDPRGNWFTLNYWKGS